MSAVRNRWIRPAVNLLIVVLTLTALSYLPPDTSLADRQKSGVLKLCVPPSYPPLVTADAQQPGFDIELTAKLAERLGLRLNVNRLSSIGTDFNPRNWSLTRGQCDIIAGGVADTVQTRSFLETIPTPIETGWVALSNTGQLPAAGGSVVVLPGTSGLDRLQLSGWLRRQSLQVIPARSPQQFVDVLASGRRALPHRRHGPAPRQPNVLAARRTVLAFSHGAGAVEGRPDAEACPALGLAGDRGGRRARGAGIALSC